MLFWSDEIKNEIFEEEEEEEGGRNAYVMFWDIFCGVIKMNAVSDFISFKLDKSKRELNTNSIFETDLRGTIQFQPVWTSVRLAKFLTD